MEAFGIVGMSMGILGFIFALSSLKRIDRLELKLKELNVINEY